MQNNIILNDKVRRFADIGGDVLPSRSVPTA